MAVAPDGSPVALYLALPGDAEARLIHAAIPAEAEVLELGCGVGRITRPLVALGHSVTGVDNSRDMLAAFARRADAEGVLADIKSLDLERRFPVVVLASHMINGEDGAVFLDAAARHVTDDGVVLVQRHEPGWVDAAAPAAAERDDIRFELTDIAHISRGVVAATAVYTVGGITYRQPFVAHDVNDERLMELAHSVGLHVVGYVDDDPCWARLVPLE